MHSTSRIRKANRACHRTRYRFARILDSPEQSLERQCQKDAFQLHFLCWIAAKNQVLLGRHYKVKYLVTYTHQSPIFLAREVRFWTIAVVLAFPDNRSLSLNEVGGRDKVCQWITLAESMIGITDPQLPQLCTISFWSLEAHENWI